MDKCLGFIGTGNMGSAMIKSIVKSGIISPGNISIYDIDKKKLTDLASETNTSALDSAKEVVLKSDVIILAVKPNMVKSVLSDCIDAFSADKLLVTIAVGIPTDFYKEILGKNKKVVRVMPNTPALVGEGMSIISCPENISKNDCETVLELFRCVGKVELLDENLMNEVTALTGSSPAYVYMFIETMADTAIQSGIPENLAYTLAAQSVLGSAKMVLETGLHPSILKDQVCSPGGTTIEAVRALESNGFRNSIIDAMNECTKKAKEIGQTYS
ncbi:MAG: pyrroline-5-carboxylate reductase [Clostridia bacterium]